ncbi:MAG: hypothetical protein WCD18_24250 [Thermosynechococcaceae cyanobacterium]
MARSRLTRSRLQQRVLLSNAEDNLRLAYSDALSAVIVWILLEGLSLLVLPNFQLISGNLTWSNWIAVSILPGLVGALFIGLSSWWVMRLQEHVDRNRSNKQLLVFWAQAVGWLGLVGVGLPMIMVAVQLWFLILRGIPE